tara:strand:+ start:1089 stop:1532 length:444 start_codon:yes stop_codon:yes gene_type:complete
MKATEREKQEQFLKMAKAVQTDERVPIEFASLMMARVREKHSLETGSEDERFLRFARNLPDNERVPYAFENRIMAQIHDLLLPDPLTHWTRMLWRAAVPCLTVMMLAMLLSEKEPADTSPSLTVDQFNFADFETVMLASFDDLELTW